MAAYQPVSFTSPGYDYGSDISQIERRRKMAEMLQQQGMQPMEQAPVAPGQFATPISPWQGAAKLATVFAAKRQSDKADQQQKDLAQRSRADLASLIMNAQKAADGTPGTALSEDASGNVTPAQPAVPGDLSKAADLYMQHPMTAPLGMGMRQQDIARKQRQQELAAIMGMGQQPTTGAAGGSAAAYGSPGFSPQGAAPQPQGGLGGLPPQALAAMLSTDPAIQGLGKHMATRGDTAGRVYYDQDNNAYTVDKSGRRINIEGTRQGLSPADRYKIPLQQADTYFNTGMRPGPLGAPQQTGQGGVPNLAQQAGRQQPPAAPQAASSPLAITPKQRAALEAERPQAEFAATSVLNGLDAMKQDLAKLKDHKGLTNVTGPIAGRTPNITGDATNAQAIIDTLKSRASVQELQRMRDASKTGGAVGAVTEKEWPRLESQLAALQQSQTTAEFRKNLAAAEETIDRMMGATTQTYQSTYGKPFKWTPRATPTEPLNDRERRELEALERQLGIRK